MKLRRHAEQIAGAKRGEKNPDVDLWMGRMRKAIVAGKLAARRQGPNGDYVALRIEVERWFRQEFREVGVAAFWMFLILSPMLLPGGGL